MMFPNLVVQDKGIQTFEKSLPDGKIKQVFFFDPDGKLFYSQLLYFVGFKIKT